MHVVRPSSSMAHGNGFTETRCKIRALILSVASLFLALACGVDDFDPRSTSRECLNHYEIGVVSGDTHTTIPTDNGSGVIEQRVLDKDLVILARVLDVDLGVVSIDSVKSRLLNPSNYERFKDTLLIEVDLQVQEYLKGEGPNRITAFIEGQRAFNTRDEGNCARSAFAAKHGRLIESKRGIAFLDTTGDSDFYHLGYADQHFVDRWEKHSTWLPGEDERFYDKKSDEWLTLVEVSQRVSSVLEEYNRSDDEKWRGCIYGKYFSKGSDPWAYRGFQLPYEAFRDHDIIFNAEHVPVPTGTMVWNYPDHGGYRSELHMTLEGEDADLFKVAYLSEYKRTANEWLAASGGSGFNLAIWYIPFEGRLEKWTRTDPGHVITAVENLVEGEYKFNLHVEDRSENFVDCGQEDFGPSKFTVIVDADRPTTPPAPVNVRVVQKDQEGWTIGWDHVHGVDYYSVQIYRLDGDEEDFDGMLSDGTEFLQHRIRFADMKGCGDVINIEIWPKGDGTTYLKAFGMPSERVQLQTEPCKQ